MFHYVFSEGLFMKTCFFVTVLISQACTLMAMHSNITDLSRDVNDVKWHQIPNLESRLAVLEKQVAQMQEKGEQKRNQKNEALGRQIHILEDIRLQREENRAILQASTSDSVPQALKEDTTVLTLLDKSIEDSLWDSEDQPTVTLLGILGALSISSTESNKVRIRPFASCPTVVDELKAIVSPNNTSKE